MQKSLSQYWKYTLYVLWFQRCRPFAQDEEICMYVAVKNVQFNFKYLYETEPACKRKKLWSTVVPLQAGLTVPARYKHEL